MYSNCLYINILYILCLKCNVSHTDIHVQVLPETERALNTIQVLNTRGELYEKKASVVLMGVLPVNKPSQ